MRMIDQSITINKINIKNRLVMPPMATAKSNEDGTVSQALCDYYDEKSAGGYIGLIITEHCFINEEGRASKGQMSLAADCDIAGLKRITDTIHKNGSKVVCQLNHAGGATSRAVTEHELLSASSIFLPKAKDTDQAPKEMNAAEILQVIEDFAAAALRAKEGGYDGIEIHSAHGYLLNQFYSPLSNKRTDEYGGGIDGRIKIHLEIIQAIREAVGPDYLIALRFGACDYMEGGSTIEDAVYAAKKFAAAGIDLLDISGGHNGYVRKDTNEPGWFAGASAAIKEAVSIPVILTGGVGNVGDAEKLLNDGKADLIGVGRAIFKDSLWAKKAMSLEQKNQPVDVFDYAKEIFAALKTGVLLTTKADGKVNSMTISYGTLGSLWEKKMFTVFVRKHRFTYGQLEKNPEFTINVPLKEFNKKILGVCGSKSGREIDKIAQLGLTLVDSDIVSVPGIKELPLTLECKVVYRQLQDKNSIPEEILLKEYPQNVDGSHPLANRDYHEMFYGEIVNAYIAL